ncbi:putative peptidase family-domain-containing protein [Aspergillus karnatakaensis]|uniref:putative peptidase family-domain-containing protein n=1 Tax=Aspergillus karnatakaensis TaxID=1810916 RepID=UPI003CCD67E4
MTKRSIDSEAISPKPRRVKPTPIEKRSFRITNFDDGETVHQTCISLHGECQAFDYAEETNFVSVTTSANFNHKQPAQNWPLHKGNWKALVMLSPGINKIELKLHHAHGIHDSVVLSLNYVPLLQLPPLHLAILVAKDSPLLIDCPPAKYGGISTAHASIDAAVSKMRMSAYMWQALTAEDFRDKGLGRRSFRLDEEWGSNTVSQSVHQAGTARSAMNAVAKVHIIRSKKTVAQIRDAQVAQQNPRGQQREALHQYFEAALASSGIPVFESRNRPVVAGLILDAHYDAEQSLILGHAALGCHKPNGISLGIFGSHLTYSWPRFMEEIPACLTDLTLAGDTVGNDNNECDTLRGACFVGQGAFLHEVGHAFGAAHTSGIMARGYSQSWAIPFIAHQANEGLKDEAKWDLRDVLKFKLLPHFALPGDDFPVSNEFKNASIIISAEVEGDDDNDDEPEEIIKISCKSGLAQVTVQSGDSHAKTYLTDVTGTCTSLQINTTIENLPRDQPLKITALAMNGKERITKDAWHLFKEKPFITIPGSKIILQKQAVQSNTFEANSNEHAEYTPWAMLLQHRGSDGNLYRATSIDLRVGCTMDGAVVYYEDGSHENCGPGGGHHFGGHASESLDLGDETITKVAICKNDDGWGSLAGIRMTLSNGKSWGHLNVRDYYDRSENSDGEGDEDRNNNDGEEDGDGVVTLEPGEDEVIVGFYGQSDVHSGFTYQFGILTAPRGVELPEAVYDMAALRNPSR